MGRSFAFFIFICLCISGMFISVYIACLVAENEEGMLCVGILDIAADYADYAYIARRCIYRNTLAIHLIRF